MLAGDVREYGHVWHFLRSFDLPYCKLYDRGYTSLGKRSATRPNPMLRKSQQPASNSSSSSSADGGEEPEECEYLPAYMLPDGSFERAGR
jgi:FAD synthetase